MKTYLVTAVAALAFVLAGSARAADIGDKAVEKKVQHTIFKAGWLHLSFLEVDGVNVASYMNFDYMNGIWVYNSGIDFSYRELSPGWVLLGYLLQWANEAKRETYDFMRGDEE